MTEEQKAELMADFKGEPVAETPVEASKELTPEQMYEMQQVSTMQIIEKLAPEFSFLVDNKLSGNQLRRLLKTLIKFPFVEDKLRLPSPIEKHVFQLGEQIIKSKMVLYAREELRNTITQLDKMEENRQTSETNSEQTLNKDEKAVS